MMMIALIYEGWFVPSFVMVHGAAQWCIGHRIVGVGEKIDGCETCFSSGCGLGARQIKKQFLLWRFYDEAIQIREITHSNTY